MATQRRQLAIQQSIQSCADPVYAPVAGSRSERRTSLAVGRWVGLGAISHRITLHTCQSYRVGS